MLSKNDVNGIFGMTVQKIIQPEYYVDEFFIWQEKNAEYKQIEDAHLKRNFLFGIYILAYSRHNLLKAIVENCPISFVYADTDSIKFIGKKYV